MTPMFVILTQAGMTTKTNATIIMTS